MSPDRMVIWPPTANPKVTVGFTRPPEILPAIDTTTKSANAWQTVTSTRPDNKNPAIPVSVTNASKLQDQITDTNTSTKHDVNVSKAKVEKNQALEHSMSENSCQLCAVEKLYFEPPPIYCTPCVARIKTNAMFYSLDTGDTRHYFCVPCFNDARADTINVEGTKVPKARLERNKNDEETEEWKKLKEENGRPLPESAVLGAKDLPRTIHSDHIESRMFGKLKQERLERAK
ncbi:histone acetyltransferase of the CBP family 12 [Artemisia annua]|uniref:histone acetyltransferase n=1 Tax=Artemisia annua TaxID=35608 RepID=A0A2U1QHU4_ARTAN|nr:histone acetyltransferase of the CBP family 12 [Artemisia annua]